MAGCGCSCGSTDAAAEPVEAAAETEEVVEDAPAEETPETDLAAEAVEENPDPAGLAEMARLRALMGA